MADGRHGGTVDSTVALLMNRCDGEVLPWLGDNSAVGLRYRMQG